MGKMVAVAAGTVHSLVRCVDGCVFACGGNESGQLGLADTHGRNMFTSLPAPVTDVVDISAGHAHSIAVTAHGAAYIWGGGRAMGGEKGLHRVIGGGVEHALVVQVSAGFYHSMLITSDGDVFSWGSGEHGQLGHGDQHNEAEPKRVPALDNNGGDTIVGVAGALRHSFVRTRRDVLAFGSSLNRTSSVSSGVVQSGCLGLGQMTILSLTPAPIKLVSHKNGDGGGDDDEAT
jgi:alpha-tubulin suppressor-like RCC1 family protein